MDDATITVDADNPKYRQITSGEHILEYTLEVGEITVDWVYGKDGDPGGRRYLLFTKRE